MLLGGLAVMVLTTGCPSALRETIVAVQIDPSVNADSIHSFALTPLGWSDTVGYSEAGVLKEITWALESQGLVHDEAHPSCHVSATLSVIPSLKHAVFAHGDPIPYAGLPGLRHVLRMQVTVTRVSIVGVDTASAFYWTGTGERKWRHRDLRTNIQYLVSDIIEYFPHPKSKLGKKSRE